MDVIRLRRTVHHPTAIIAAWLIQQAPRVCRPVRSSWRLASAAWLVHSGEALKIAQRLVERRPDLAASLERIGRDYVAACRAAERLAPWRSRLTPMIEARRSAHLKSAARLAGRLFAEKPKAFRRRIAALWSARNSKDH